MSHPDEQERAPGGEQATPEPAANASPEPAYGGEPTEPGEPGAAGPAGEPGADTAPTAETSPQAPPTSGTGRPAGTTKVRRTRFSVLWTTVIIAAVVLVLLLIFILQNNSTVTIYYFGAQGRLPLGVAMLFAAIGGILLVAIPGYGRIVQLRRAVRKAGRGRR